MHLLEKATVQSFHRQRLTLDEMQALGYRDQESQQRRFETLARWGDFSNCSVLDLGCGFGDLRPFLADRFTNTIYLGIDFLKEFVEAASKKYGDLPNTQFFQADFLTAGLPEVDCVIASGSLNYRSENELHPWQSISRMWEIAQKGIVFNLLDAQYFRETSLLRGYHPDDVLAFCQQLDPHAELHRGYLPDDFTLFLRKPQSNT